MGTHGIGVFGINSKFASGNLVFYEKAVGRTATGDVLTIGTTAVNVGGTSQAVDFGWYATSASVVISASGTSLTLVGVNMATNAPVVITDATAASSATAGALIVTGGIATAAGIWVGTTSRLVGAITADATLGIAGLVTSTSTTGFRSNPTFVPDANRTNYALAVGFGHSATNELAVTMAAATTQHLDPIALNLNIIGANPTGSSTINGMYQNITHDTTDMSYLRLKNTDFNVVIGKDILDAYCYQGEIDFNAAGIAVGGEAAVMGLVMNAGTNAVTGNLRGLIISMQGAGSYASVVGLEIRTTCGDVLGHGCSEAIRIAGTPLPVVGIAMGNQTNNNEGPQYAFFFPSTGSPDTGPWSATNATGDAGKVAIKIGANTRYINVYTS